MSWGNKPTDDGNFILSPKEKDELLENEPTAAKFVHRYMSGGDFINGVERYCLWLASVEPSELRALPRVMKRVEAVKVFRLKSDAASTRNYAKYPTLFRQIAQPDSNYLAIPEVSSERRAYVPTAYLDKEVICSNTIQFVPNAGLFHFGVLTSNVHMAWMRQVCGRLESRYRYSNSLVYNNFPWPESPTDKQKAAVEAKAQAVLDARAVHMAPNITLNSVQLHSSSGSVGRRRGSTLADLYDPLTMPPNLTKAHAELDRAVDACYRAKPFDSDRERVEFLFALYEKLTAPLTAGLKEPKAKKGKKGTA
jgi:hypothetical protein